MFSNGQPGLTTNFILREGSEDTEGVVKYTTSDYDLRRFDGYISGPIAEDFYYMIGGYITSSPGLRDAGYNSDEGNQFTINLTRELDNGKINRLPPADRRLRPVVPAGGAQRAGRGRRVQPARRHEPAAPDHYQQRERGTSQTAAIRRPPTRRSRRSISTRAAAGGAAMTGGSVVLDVADDWQLTDRFGFTTGDADTIGLVPDGGAVQVGALLADPAVDPRAVVIGPITGAVTGRAIGTDEFIQQFGAWEVRKDVEAFTNDISLTWDLRPGDGDVRLLHVQRLERRPLVAGQPKYEVVQQGGEIVTGIACNDPAVDSCGGNFDIDGSGDATTNALYAATTFDITDALRADVGVRYEKYEIDYTVDDGRDGDVDFGASTDESEVSWTAALNYHAHRPDGRLRPHQPGSLDAAVRHLSGRPRCPRQRQ